MPLNKRTRRSPLASKHSCNQMGEWITPMFHIFSPRLLAVQSNLRNKDSVPGEGSFLFSLPILAMSGSQTHLLLKYNVTFRTGYIYFSKENVQPEPEKSTTRPLCPFPQCFCCEVAPRGVTRADLEMIQIIVVNVLMSMMGIMMNTVDYDQDHCGADECADELDGYHDEYCCFSAPSKDP